MRPITYSLQFRGQAVEVAGGLRKEGRAPGCALVTRLTPAGVEGHYVWSPDDAEAYFESTLAFTAGGAFEEQGAILFGRGHGLYLHGYGQLGTSPDPHLRQGTVVWEIAGGKGRFEGASGKVTSHLFLSDTGDLTENQLGVVFSNAPQRPT